MRHPLNMFIKHLNDFVLFRKDFWVYISVLEHCRKTKLRAQVHLTLIIKFTNNVRLGGFVACTGSPYVECMDVYITGTEHNRKL